MIPKKTLKTLINRYQKDSKTLLRNRRYATSIYIAGYSLELALKYKICLLFRFKNGYPENDAEFSSYSQGSSRFTGTTIRHIKNLKIHNLSDLLFYSGEQININSKFSSEWRTIVTWNVRMRYEASVVRKNKAQNYVDAARSIIGQLI